MERITNCNIQFLLNGTLVLEIGQTQSFESNEIAGPAANTFDPNLFTNDIEEYGSKLYRPSSEKITTDLSFSQITTYPIITDSKGGIEATLNNFTDVDTNLTGLTFDGSTKYIDLTANSINVGGDETIGNGFSFETYVKNDPVYELSNTAVENTTHPFTNYNGTLLSGGEIRYKYPCRLNQSNFMNLLTVNMRKPSSPN